MQKLTRRSLIGGSLGLAAAGVVGRPYLANAAVKPAAVDKTLNGFEAIIAKYPITAA